MTVEQNYYDVFVYRRTEGVDVDRPAVTNRLVIWSSYNSYTV